MSGSNSPQDMAGHWKERLTSLRALLPDDPLSNPVRQVAHEISIQIEAGNTTLEELAAVVKALSDEALKERGTRLRNYLQIDAASPSSALAPVVQSISDSQDSFEAFKANWEKRRDVIVFTGHPTFVLSRKQREWLVNYATGVDCLGELSAIEHYPDQSITLADEHDAVMFAMREASASVTRFHRAVLETARARFPDTWREISPSAVAIATWVGYDMDGRNDIGWQEVVRHRISEKLFRLQRYNAQLSEATDENTTGLTKAAEILRAAIEHCEKALELLRKPLSNESDIATVADHLTGGAGKLTKTSPLLDILAGEAALADEATAINLATLAADMRTFQLGAGEIHFRLNASQIRNAAREVLSLRSDDDLFGRKALARVQELIQSTEPVEVNFASLAIEKSSARRIFIAAAQILKHIDSDQPIRLLVAELENPVTILSAIYLARLFGIEDRIDICPLFETPRALDRSRRILDVLFQQPSYQKYVERRGRISIQAGFSDAGRFMGQVPAGLAIERLHGHFADLMEKNGLAHLDAVIFNTHGESLGRGHHQRSLQDRALYALSPWARRQFSSRKIHLIHESSFQGGDGYLHFGNELSSDAILAGILLAHEQAKQAADKDDLFYQDISTSLDFYRNVKARQEALYSDNSYQTSVSAIGLSFLPTTGSRKTKRQFEFRTSEEPALRSIRAIPHNATLQQLSVLANLTAGLGQAMLAERDYFVELAGSSDRFERLMSMAAQASALSSIKTFVAYMKLFDGSFWATRPMSGKEPHLEDACATLATELGADSRYFSALQLAAKLRSDNLRLSKALTEMGLQEINTTTPVCLDLLHAIRIAVIQHLFLLSAKLPELAAYAGLKKQDIMRMIFAFDIETAQRHLNGIFPPETPQLGDYKLQENATYPLDESPEYNRIRTELIDPLQECELLVKRITNGISHYYSALG